MVVRFYGWWSASIGGVEVALVLGGVEVEWGLDGLGC